MIAPSWIIQKKRDGKELKKEELRAFIHGLSSGTVADYQASAFLMAVYFQNMTLEETVTLTEAMLESGERYDLSHISGCKVDKHSTGGVGDKVSLILAPLAAACGLRVPMMSGRGLGHTGGTVDKLESIPGFNVNLSKERFSEILAQVGCAMTSQTDKIAPADKKLYALRDVTGTVECIPLITASILSKKLAEGTDALVLDVKIGNGAFMKTREQARRLARTIIQVARKMKLPCRAILSSMNQPLGYAVGNTIEVYESIEILRNEKKEDLSSTDLKELTLHLCGQMLHLGKVVRNLNEGRKLAQSKLNDGSAWKVFQELVKAQGGDLTLIQQPEKLLLAPQKTTWKAKRRGYIAKMNTEELGKTLIELGGGRKRAGDPVDPSVGLVFHRKLGAKIQMGEPLVTVYSQPHTDLDLLENQFHQSIEISGTRKAVPKLIFEQLT
jgi:pyrimidine-nucleoside phosphorylase